MTAEFFNTLNYGIAWVSGGGGGCTYEYQSPNPFYVPPASTKSYWKCAYCDGLNSTKTISCKHCSAPRRSLNE